MNNFENPLPGVPSIESPFFKNLFPEENTEPELLRTAKSLCENGFAVIDFPEENFEEISRGVINDLADKYDWAIWNNGKGIGPRLSHAYKYSEHVHKISSSPKVISLLSQLYGRKAMPFQTLNFPIGTQQPFHSDIVHFSSVPEKYMCGVWVALEDIDEDNGPLEYFRGSHKWPIYLNEHIGKPRDPVEEKYKTYGSYINFWQKLVDAMGVKPETLPLKKGQAVIWCANLLHGGSTQKNKNRSRHSQVTHYYFNDCSYYVPVSSDPFSGKIYFHSFKNIATDEPMINRNAGQEVPLEFINFTSVFQKSQNVD